MAGLEWRGGIGRSLTEVDDPEGAAADLPAELELAPDDAVHAAAAAGQSFLPPPDYSLTGDGRGGRVASSGLRLPRAGGEGTDGGGVHCCCVGRLARFILVESAKGRKVELFGA